MRLMNLLALGAHVQLIMPTGLTDEDNLHYLATHSCGNSGHDFGETYTQGYCCDKAPTTCDPATHKYTCIVSALPVGEGGEQCACSGLLLPGSTQSLPR